MSENRFLAALRFTLLALLVLEFCLRLTGFSYYWAIWKTPDINLGWRPLPETRGWQRLEGEALVETNSLGFRGPEPAAAEIPAYRIALLGDSFTEAVQLPFEKSWGPQLAEQLDTDCGLEREIHVQNFSVSGYSTAQESRVLQEIIPDYRPDLVLLMFFAGNDILEAHPALARNRQRPFYDAATVQWRNDFRDNILFRMATFPVFRQLWRELLRLRVTQASVYISHVATLLARKVVADDAAGEPGVSPEIYVAPTDPHWQAAWDNTEALLAGMARTAGEMGADFLVAMAPTGYQVFPDADFRKAFAAQLGADDLFYPERRLHEFATTQGIPLLPLAPLMATFAESRGVVLHGFSNTAPGIGHWNAAGQRLAAQLLGPVVCRTLRQREVETPRMTGNSPSSQCLPQQSQEALPPSGFASRPGACCSGCGAKKNPAGAGFPVSVYRCGPDQEVTFAACRPLGPFSIS
jgi:hypothetical protein